MRIYIAAPYAIRDILRRHAEYLEDKGHTITSTWLQATHEIHAGTLETAPSLDDEYARSHSLKDIEEVKGSDLLVLVTWNQAVKMGRGIDLQGNSGGRHVEVGVALAAGIPVLIWGQPENIFHRGLCTICPTLVDVFEAIEFAPTLPI